MSCCYARSDKYWVTDPAGVAWETFHSLGSVPVYGEDDATRGEESQASACGDGKSACCGTASAETKTKAACCAN